MKKSIYTVHIYSRILGRYVTTTRNAEDMISQLRQMYCTDEMLTYRIYRKTEGEEEVLIHRENYKRPCK